MKKTLLLISLLVSVLTFAQNNGINYQAVIYSTGGESIPGIHNSNSPLVNKPICLQFGIVDENTQIEYQEKVTVTTDDFGMVNLVIGNGTQIGGYASSFNAIDWSNSRKNLKVSLDESGSCSNFYEISNQVLTYVPYALAANSAATVSGVVSIAHGGTNSSTLIGAKTNLQLQNVDNTSDLNKPLSIATQTALSSKVDKVVGKDLSTNDYTTAEKTKLAEILGINTGDQDLSSYATTSALTTKVDKVVGKDLSSNDYTTVEKTKLAGISGINTGDQDLSSYATTSALATKVDKVVGKELSTNDYTTVEKTKLAGISGINTGDQDLSSYATTSALATKVDKVVGKELSTNDYTTVEKTKLAGISGINTGDQDLSSYATTTALTTKVDKVSGKELSTNDYTTAEKTKLAGISGINTGDQDLSSYATITALAAKVDKVVGKDLSSNDYTTVEKTKLARISGINTGDQDLSSYATSTDLGLKANSISPAFSGVPTAPTAVSGTNTTQLATTAFVSDAVTGKFVDITTNQAISGTKTFSSNIIANLSGNASTASNITGGTVGQLPYQTSSNTTSFLAANTSSTRKFLSSVGSSGSATVPSWQSLSTSDIVSSSSQTSGYLNFETGVFSAQNWTELNTQWTITSGWANTRDYNGTAYQGSYSIIAPDSQDFTLEGSKDFNLASLYIQRDMNGTATSVEFKGYNAAGNLVGTVTVATSSLNLFSYSNININFNGIRKLVFHPIGFDLNAMGGGSFFLDYFNVSILTSNNLNSVNGILKSDGNGNITAAVAGTDYLNSTSLSGYLPVTGGNITGTLGVGTTSNYANSKVHIAGNGLVVWGGTGTLLDASGNSHGYNENVALTVDGKAGSDILQLRNSAPSTLLVVDQNGKMGIGNTSPSEKLEVTGNVKASGKLTTGTITLPNTDGTSGQVLTTNGLGIVSWTTPSTISTSNFVNLTTDQTIAGNKAFSSELTINNTKFGRGSGSNTDNRNIGIGNFSLSSNASGSWNTAIGTYALQKNTDSWSNTAIGNEAISESIPGSNNTGVGSRSLMYTSGTGNTSVGTNALINSTTGNNNTAIGLNAFSTNTTGSNNTAIGSSTVVSSTGITNATAIGFGATVASNNTIQLGNTLVTNVNTYGSITANAAISDEITSDLTINTTNVEQYKGRVLICNPSNPITITFGSQLPKGFNCMILQKSIDANIINLAGETGVTIKNRNNYTSTAGNYAILTVVSIGGDIIVTAGDMQ